MPLLISTLHLKYVEIMPQMSQIVLFMVNFSNLNHNRIQHRHKTISGRKYKIAWNYFTFKLHVSFHVMETIIIALGK